MKYSSGKKNKKKYLIAIVKKFRGNIGTIWFGSENRYVLCDKFIRNKIKIEIWEKLC